MPGSGWAGPLIIRFFRQTTEELAWLVNKNSQFGRKPGYFVYLERRLTSKDAQIFSDTSSKRIVHYPCPQFCSKDVLISLVLRICYYNFSNPLQSKNCPATIQNPAIPWIWTYQFYHESWTAGVRQSNFSQIATYRRPRTPQFIAMATMTSA